MTTAALPLPKPVKGPPLVTSEVFGMLIWVFAEVMLFAGFISGYNLVGARAPAGWWPPPGDPALPVASTAAASLALLASGVAVWWAGRPASRAAAGRALGIAVVLALVFVGYQVAEFARLLAIGFTLVSSAHGGFFYTIIGAHALHAVSAVVALGWGWRKLSNGTLSEPLFAALRIYWFFVVLLWPVLFTVVYL